MERDPPARALPDLWSTPARFPLGRLLGLAGVACALLAALLWWQAAPGPVLLVGPLTGWQLFGVLSAASMVGLSGWLFSLAWRLELLGDVVTFLAHLLAIFFVIGAWLAAAIWGLAFVLLQDDYARLDSPGSEGSYVVRISEYAGVGTLSLYRGGPFVFERLEVRLPTSFLPKDLGGDLRVEVEKGTSYLI